MTTARPGEKDDNTKLPYNRHGNRRSVNKHDECCWTPPTALVVDISVSHTVIFYDVWQMKGTVVISSEAIFIYDLLCTDPFVILERKTKHSWLGSTVYGRKHNYSIPIAFVSSDQLVSSLP